MSKLTHPSRSKVFEDLFSLLKTVQPPTGNSWKTASQYLRIWDDVPAGEQPAIFLHRGVQIAEQHHAYGVTKWVWKATVWIYYKTDGLKTSSTYPDQYLDQFLDNMELAFQTDPLAGPLTLDEKVVNCWIDGQIVFDSGIVDGQAVLILPISIMI